MSLVTLTIGYNPKQIMEKYKKNDPVYEHLRIGLKHSLEYIRKFADKEQVPTMKVKDVVIQSDGSFKTVSRTVKDYTDLIYHHRSQLLDLPKVKDLIEFLAKNEYINESIFPLLKSKSVPFNKIGYADEYRKSKVRDTIYLKFLINYCKFEVFPLFKEKYFYDLFVRLMYYLQSSKKWYSISPLISFEMESNSVELDDGLTIRRIRPEEFLVMNEKYKGHFDSFRVKYVIELYSELAADMAKSFFEDKMDLVLEVLRLFKKGTVDSMLIVNGVDEDNWVIGTSAMIFNTHRIPNSIIYNLNRDEIIVLKRFYKEVKNAYNTAFLKNAFRRFSLAIKEKDLDDKIIDFFIALESLFSDGLSEMTYKLRIKIAFLIGTTKHDRDYIYKFVNKAYKLRSEIIHGGGEGGNWKFVINSKNLGKEEVLNQLEDITRLAIKRILNMIRNSQYVKKDIINQIDTFMINGMKLKPIIT